MHEQPNAEPPSLRAALYIRTGAYPELGQSDTGPLHAYAAQRGYHVVATYRDEGASGRNPQRPGLTQLLTDAARHRVDVVLVAARSVLASTPVESQPIVEELQQSGVAVESLAYDLSLPPPKGAPAETRAGTAVSGGAVDPSRIHVGMEVYGSNGSFIGTVKQIYDADVWVDRTMQRDVFVPFTAMQAIADDRIVLDVISGRVGDMGWAKPTITGQERPNP